jgi:hypothetical protein
MDTSFYHHDSFAVHLAVHLAMSANHEDKKITFNNEEITVKRGSLITGRKVLANALGIHESAITRKLELLQNVGFLNIETNNRYSIITIVKYKEYQPEAEKRTAERTTSEQPANTNKNYKELKEVNKDIPKDLVQYFIISLSAGFKVDYAPDWGKDCALAKKLLAVVSAEEIKAMIDKYLKLPKDTWEGKQAKTFGLFYSRYNNIKQHKVASRYISAEEWNKR